MTFLWPEGLWGLALVPILVALYILILQRKKNALAYSNLALVKVAMGKTSSFRRHLPPALLLAGFVVMLLALARPAAVVTLPSQHETVILALDVSGSMRADDVKPTRLAAAQAAARAFLKDTPSTTRIGVVAFAGSAALVQPPTRSREEVMNAIEQLQLQNATGEGLSIRVRLDEDALKVIADMTRAEYFFAGNAPDLKKIYQGLNSKLVMEKKETEITALFTAVAASFTLLAAALSLLWFNRILSNPRLLRLAGMALI